jgi:hypothetical protein
MPVMIALGLLMLAVPFWIAYLTDRLKWWSLGVAGLFSLAGVVMLAFFSLLSLFKSGSQAFYVIVNAGLALALLALFLTVRRFDWAAWAAAGFALSALASVWLPSSASWAVLALTMGVYIVYRQLDTPMKAAAARAQAQRQAQRQARQAQSGGTPPPQAAAPQPPAAPPPAPASQAQSIAPVIPASEEAPPPSVLTPDQRPVVQFRPLDPLSTRKAAGDEDES